jgi:hypothetical protein
MGFILFGCNTPKLASFVRATESVAGAFNTTGPAPSIFINSLMLRGGIVAQTAKSARSGKNAAFSGRFGNLRYDATA